MPAVQSPSEYRQQVTDRRRAAATGGHRAELAARTPTPGMPSQLVKTLTWDQGSEMAGHAVRLPDSPLRPRTPPMPSACSPGRLPPSSSSAASNAARTVPRPPAAAPSWPGWAPPCPGQPRASRGRTSEASGEGSTRCRRVGRRPRSRPTPPAAPALLGELVNVGDDDVGSGQVAPVGARDRPPARPDGARREHPPWTPGSARANGRTASSCSARCSAVWRAPPAEARSPSCNAAVASSNAASIIELGSAERGWSASRGLTTARALRWAPVAASAQARIRSGQVRTDRCPVRTASSRWPRPRSDAPRTAPPGARAGRRSWPAGRAPRPR